MCEEKIMVDMTKEDKAALLRLARSAIEAELIKGAKVRRPENLAPVMKEKRGCFVTLHKKGTLRGCIGNIEPVKPLVSCVEENALNAAFCDPRFASLVKEELEDINIEISVLSVPQQLYFEDADDLKKKLKPGIHGVILSSNFHKSTFLPQVWNQLPDIEIFLDHLCLKAGTEKGCWKNKETRIHTYEARYFSEPL
jgi:AmmeMemoRadiSam system protein A